MKRLKEGGLKEKYEILSTCFYFSPSLNSSQTDRQSPVPVGNVGGGDVQGGGGVLPRTAAGTGGGGAVGQAGEHAGLTALVPLLRQTLKDKNTLVRLVRA
jgi:hypothetical protein